MTTELTTEPTTEPATELTAAPAKSGFAVTVADLRCRYREDGLRALVAKIVAKLRRSVYWQSEVVVLKKDLGQITAMEFTEALRIEELDFRHLPALYEFNRRRCFNKADARAAAALERGYRGFVGYVDDQLVGYYWWVDAAIEPNHSDIAHYGLDIDLQPAEVYGFDFYLLEEHRGDGKATEFLYKIEVALRDLGYDLLWGYVVADNKPARWLYSLRGYKSVRKVSSRSVLGRRRTVRTVPS
jgi:GNAT superfamily N-acetyltransferase